MYDVRPVIVDLGKKRRRTIEDLKRGEGSAMDEVQDAIDEVRARMGPEAEGKILLPVIVIYRKKPKQKGGLLGMG